MTIVLCSRAALPAMIARHDPEIIVSAVGRGEAVPEATVRCGVIHLAFNDVQRDKGPWRAPTARHVDRLFAATDAWSRSRPIVVHCHEGRSRAPAVVLGVLCRLGLDADVAVGHLLSAAPWAAPHEGFMHLVDGALGQSPGLVRAMRKMHVAMHSSERVSLSCAVAVLSARRTQGLQ